MYQALLCLSLFTPGGEPCPCPGGTCVREQVVTKLSTPHYTVKCSEFCLPKYHLLGFLCKDNCDCHPMKKRELVKKVCVEEKCECKCVLKPCTPCAACEAGTVIVPAK